jgi:hypothetical protein
MSRTRLVAAGAAAALVLATCGGDGQPGTAEGSPSQPTPLASASRPSRSEGRCPNPTSFQLLILARASRRRHVLSRFVGARILNGFRARSATAATGTGLGLAIAS